MKILKMEDIEERIILIRGENVLLDADVAKMYDVATKEVNQALFIRSVKIAVISQKEKPFA